MKTKMRYLLIGKNGFYGPQTYIKDPPVELQEKLNDLADLSWPEEDEIIGWEFSAYNQFQASKLLIKNGYIPTTSWKLLG